MQNKILFPADTEKIKMERCTRFWMGKVAASSKFAIVIYVVNKNISLSRW